jgi:hypothetical protein
MFIDQIALSYFTLIVIVRLSMDPDVSSGPEFSPSRPGPVHMSLTTSSSRQRDSPALPRKKDQYSYRDDSGANCGPFDLPTLHLWWSYGLIPDNLQISEGSSSTTVSLSDVLRLKGLDHQPIEDRNEWFLWTDQRNPFHSLTARLTKSFQTRHQKNSLNLLSLVSPTITLNRYQEFEEFLETGPVIADEIKQLNLNSFAEPFAMWIWKMLLELNAKVSPLEVRALLLETDPDRARAFFLFHLTPEAHALRVFSIYNQWRLFIPIFVVGEEQ